MTTIRREALRQIMLVAHNWKRPVRSTKGAAQRTAGRAPPMRNTPRVVFRSVKPGAQGVSPLRETAFLARRFDRRHSGFRYAAESRSTGVSLRS